MASFGRMGEEVSVAPAPVLQPDQEWAARLENTIERGANHLLSLQAEEGFWQGELEADTTLESDYIYYLHVLGKADPERIAKNMQIIRSEEHTSELQSPDHLVCRLLLEKKKTITMTDYYILH